MLIHRVLFCLFLVCLGSDLWAQESTPDWWGQKVAKAVSRAGDNGSELRTALRESSEADRPEIAFLLRNMPNRDLRTLKAAFLLANVAAAKVALARAPWGASIPRPIFLNDILPYAHVSESRESWRPALAKRFWPLVKDCKSPGEAAQRLNKEIFNQLGVKYSTARRRADQSPSESIDSGLASCTGLSILLADACRAVGVPARLAGIKSWVNKRGNHTWVEVWDQGWHFTGAAEWSSKGLDHGWFQADAAKAIADQPDHAIYAVSFRKTDAAFPMVWRRGGDPVHGVNVTARYVTPAKLDASKMRLMVRVRDANGLRVAVPVTVVRDADGAVLRGKSRGQTNDTNDFLSFVLERKASYTVRATGATSAAFRPGKAAEQLIDLVRSEERDEGLEAVAQRWFDAEPADRNSIAFEKTWDAALLTADGDAATRAAVWSAFRKSKHHSVRRKNFAAKRVPEREVRESIHSEVCG